MLDLSKNYCYDSILRNEIKSLYSSIKLYNVPNKEFVYNVLSKELQISIDKIETGFGTIDIIDRLLSLFKNKTVTSIGPHWSGIKWVCEKHDLKFDDHGDIVYIARPNGRDGLLRDINFDDYEFVIIDEAYGDFCDDSFIQHNHINSIVIKTFSKSLSIPGIRFAYSVSSSEIISQLKNLSYRYSMNIVAQDIITDALHLIAPHIERMKKTKTFLENKFEHLPSYSNFVRMLDKPPYKIRVPKIDNFYRFTLVDMKTLYEL